MVRAMIARHNSEKSRVRHGSIPSGDVSQFHAKTIAGASTKATYNSSTMIGMPRITST